MPKKLIDALSDVGVRGAKPALRDGVPVDRKLHDGRGLYLLVRANGARHWRLKFYLAGRERLLALGEYPDVTLARARQKAGEVRNLIREGIDPIQSGREQKALRVNAAQQTFAVEAYAGHSNTLGIIRLILWTGSRTGEVRGATPDEFDLAGVWRIPAERMKKRGVHVVPLNAVDAREGRLGAAQLPRIRGN